MEAPISGNLFAAPTPLSSRTVEEVALSPADYRHLEELLVLPIAHIEVATLAMHLPIAFVRRDAVVTMVSVLGLRAGRTILKVVSEVAPASFPLQLKAFPLGIGGRDDDGRVRLVAETIPTEPLTPRMAAFSADGSLAAPLLDKADALWLYAAAQATTEQIIEALDLEGAFTPWKLRLVFEDGAAPIDDLLAIAPDFCDKPGYAELVRRFGAEVAVLVEHHLLSKSRINWLAFLDGEIGRALSGGRR